MPLRHIFAETIETNLVRSSGLRLGFDLGIWEFGKRDTEAALNIFEVPEPDFDLD